MRIISGKYRGKQLHPPRGLVVRPTTDFAKEGLFNVLNNLVSFEELSVLDLFAGTGSISYEFFSRGAREVTAIDINPLCIAFINKTCQGMNAANIKAVKANVFSYLGRFPGSFDLVFADPPYDMAEIEILPRLIFDVPLLKADGLLILEHSGQYDFSPHPFFYQQRVFGNVNFSLFRKRVE